MSFVRHSRARKPPKWASDPNRKVRDPMSQDVFDVELTDTELAAIDGLDTGERGGPEPEDVTLESFGREIPEA